MSSTRNKLIAILEKNQHQYVSGQDLSDQLQISRNAVWKHMNELKKDGYIIEAKPNKGYRIISFPDKLSENTIQWGLQTKWLAKSILHKETITSTQTVAHELAQDGAEEGTIVIADEQTKGRGRMRREWHSTKGKGIWMSIILRPKILPQDAPQITLMTAVALAKAIESFLQLEQKDSLAIKWPNDLLISGKKIAGILTEMQAEQDLIQYIIVGIGMNVNHRAEDIQEEIKNKATSLAIATGENWPIKNLIQKVLVEFEKTYEEYVHNGFSDIKAEWESYGFKIGENIKIRTFHDCWEAPFLGIAEDGALLTKDKDGNKTKLYSGEIDWFTV